MMPRAWAMKPLQWLSDISGAVRDSGQSATYKSTSPYDASATPPLMAITMMNVRLLGCCVPMMTDAIRTATEVNALSLSSHQRTTFQSWFRTDIWMKDTDSER